MSEINHIGTVIQVAAKEVKVAITSHSACATCREKSSCGISESKQKIVDVQKPAFDVKVGDNVLVTTTMANAGFSVVLAYVIPVILLIGAIVTVQMLGKSELFAAVASIFCVILYYLVLFLFKDRIKKRICFTIKQIDKGQKDLRDEE